MPEAHTIQYSSPKPTRRSSSWVRMRKVKEIFVFLHILFDGLVFLFDLERRERPHGFGVHHAHKSRVVRPAAFDFGVFVVVKRGKADEVAFEEGCGDVHIKILLNGEKENGHRVGLPVAAQGK